MSKPIIKRSITSDVAKLFYPIGFLSPVEIRAKVLIQDLWRQGEDWDHPIPVDSKNAWITFRKQLKGIESISIPRWLRSLQNSTFELHCFRDASEKAFAATIYAVVHLGDNIYSKLITAKSKVAPIKTFSRLELYGAVVLDCLTKYVLNKLEKIAIQGTLTRRSFWHG